MQNLRANAAAFLIGMVVSSSSLGCDYSSVMTMLGRTFSTVPGHRNSQLSNLDGALSNLNTDFMNQITISTNQNKEKIEAEFKLLSSIESDTNLVIKGLENKVIKLNAFKEKMRKKTNSGVANCATELELEIEFISCLKTEISAYEKNERSWSKKDLDLSVGTLLGILERDLPDLDDELRSYYESLIIRYYTITPII